MMQALGMKFVPTDDDSVVVSMPITPAACQHRGIVHGGAYLTLAETAAGAGSLHVAGPGSDVCGVEVSGNHLAPSPTEGEVRARATLLSAGNTLHVWNVDITSGGQMLSTARVVNRIFKTLAVVLAMTLAMTACVTETGKPAPDTATCDTPATADEDGVVVGIVGDGTSMHALEIITLDTHDSLYFTYEVNGTDGIEIGDTVRVTYDFEMGDDALTSIQKIQGATE